MTHRLTINLTHTSKLALTALIGALCFSCGMEDEGLDLENIEGQAEHSFFDPATGSFGGFSAKAFLEAEIPWKIIRVAGPHKVACEQRGGNPERCTRDKDYTFFTMRQAHRTSSINDGVPVPMFHVKRHNSPVLRTVEMSRNANRLRQELRMDGNSVSSRLRFDNAQAITMTRLPKSDYEQAVPMGHIEGKKGNKWVRLSPFSYYYWNGEETNFGLTTVEKQWVGSLFREGTYICASDQWSDNDGFMSLLAKDQFEMDQCKDNLLLSSETVLDLPGAAQSIILKRQDSTVNFVDTKGRQRSYHVEAKREWLCPFDCDGSKYSVHPSGKESPAAVHVDTDQWNFQSNSNFKIKIVRADWDGDGQFAGMGADLRDIANDPENYQEIVAVIVSEMASARGDGYNAEWVQKTTIIFPPIEGALRTSIFEKRYNKDDNGRLMYNLKLLDAALALMPDQTANSPELADAEEKADELRLYTTLIANKGNVADDYYIDFMYDIYSPYDPTTAVSWAGPEGGQSAHRNKIEWILDKLGY